VICESSRRDRVISQIRNPSLKGSLSSRTNAGSQVIHAEPEMRGRIAGRSPTIAQASTVPTNFVPMMLSCTAEDAVRRMTAYPVGFDGGKEEAMRLVEEAKAYPGDSEAEAKFALVLLYNREK
jgi:hypothetical protein